MMCEWAAQGLNPYLTNPLESLNIVLYIIYVFINSYGGINMECTLTILGGVCRVFLVKWSSHFIIQCAPQG